MLEKNYFSIDVSTPNYSNISMTVYRYRLDGIDTGWRISDMTNGTVDISYSGLPSGDYTLEVQSSMQGAQNSANRSQRSPGADDCVRTQARFSNINHHIIIHQSSINELIDDTLTNH